MLQKAWKGVCRYLKQTDTLLMVLALLICACGLVLIFSGCQSVKKVNPQRLILPRFLQHGLPPPAAADPDPVYRHRRRLCGHDHPVLLRF